MSAPRTLNFSTVSGSRTSDWAYKWRSDNSKGGEIVTEDHKGRRNSSQVMMSCL